MPACSYPQSLCGCARPRVPWPGATRLPRPPCVVWDVVVWGLSRWRAHPVLLHGRVMLAPSSGMLLDPPFYGWAYGCRPLPLPAFVGSHCLSWGCFCGQRGL